MSIVSCPDILRVVRHVYGSIVAPTQEPHICHTFSEPFYGKNMKLLVVAFLRPELNFDSLGPYFLPPLSLLPSIPLLCLPRRCPHSGYQE